MLSVICIKGRKIGLYAGCHYAECRYAECLYVECRYAVCCYSECHGAHCTDGVKKTNYFIC